MYINDINIFIYVGIGILGLLIGRLIEIINISLVEHKKIFSLQSVKENFKIVKANYIIIITIAVLYIAVLLSIGLDDKIKLVQYLILIPMLMSVFLIDLKKQIIPSRLTLSLFEIGVIFSFIRGINNLNTAIEMWLGLVVGVVIFFIISFVGSLVFKKETMGFGDVKLMGALGLCFGWRSIIVITIVSFFMASIFSFLLIIFKKIKKQHINEFIPFGPFIVLGAVIAMFVPVSAFIKLIFFVFTLGKI